VKKGAKVREEREDEREDGLVSGKKEYYTFCSLAL
jgi:hypothetical protein